MWRLEIAADNWRSVRPEILENLIVVTVDPISIPFLPEARVVQTPRRCDSERASILNALVLDAPFHVETPWFLKLDTDTLAREGEWCEPEWFSDDPVFVSPPWGYTKPPGTLSVLDAWADKYFGEVGRPARIEQPGRDKHKRIISFAFWCQTWWARQVATYCENQLPVASQDTYHWYVAHRRRDKFKRQRMPGWRHVNRKELRRMSA